MEKKDKMIHSLRSSLQISVTINVLAALLIFGLITAWHFTGGPGWSPVKWWKSAFNTPEVPPLVRPDSSTQAIARQLSLWEAPGVGAMPQHPDSAALVEYGKDLIANTSKYLGPKGSVAALTNGMNCQNCHLEAGTKSWGNNYGAVASTYPKFRERSGSIESLPKRINDCMERSLNGQPLSENSREMKAMMSYIKWLGTGIPKGEVPNGSGIYSLPLLSRAADPAKGAAIYAQKCLSCHGIDGHGVLAGDQVSYTYPPLWGPNSYNSGAGLYRLSRLAGYIKYNMPFGVTWQNPQLSDEECWDVAAFINSQPRPAKDLSGDWPNLAGKPFDHPFGPYADGFSEKQHKYGPFEPIKDKLKALKSK